MSVKKFTEGDMRAILLLGVLMVAGCGTMQPVDLCLKTGLVADLIRLDLCGKVGDGEFNPEVNLEGNGDSGDAVDSGTAADDRGEAQ